MRRNFQTSEEPLDERLFLDMPTDEPLAVYYRQSSMAQVGNVSTSMQTIDMVAEMKRRGWAEENITLIDMDAGVSGTKRIDERPGMSQLFDLIQTGKISAVACQDEDRLFRDVTQIQVNIFIEECRKARVVVITPSLTYIFHHPTQGPFYAKQFRFKSELAAEHLNFIKNRMSKARNRILKEGRWAGGRVPVGFMVDMREKLENGAPNPNYRLYVPFPEYVGVVNSIFEIFIEKQGSLYATQRALMKRGILYPDGVQPPPGFHFSNYLGERNLRFPTTAAIRGIVTNPVYIGHWMFKGAVIIYDNHEQIVPTDLFFKAFNLISPFALDGSENSNYRKIRRNHRPSREVNRGKPRPLAEGLVYIAQGDKWRKCGCEWLASQNDYSYGWIDTKPADHFFRRGASRIDDALVYLIQKRLGQPEQYDPQLVQRELDAKAAYIAAERSRLLAQLNACERSQQNIENTLLHTSAGENLILRLEKRYEEFEAEKRRLHGKIMELDQQSSSDKLTPVELVWREAVASWDYTTDEERRQIVVNLIKRVEIKAWSKGTLDLAVIWHDDSKSEITVTTQGNAWTLAQYDRLHGLIGEGASRDKVMEEFPDKSWDTLRQVIRRFYPDIPLPQWE